MLFIWQFHGKNIGYNFKKKSFFVNSISREKKPSTYFTYTFFVYVPAFTRLGHIIPSPSGSSVGGSELSRHRDQRRCCALVHVEVVVDEPKQQQPPPFAAVITFTM